MTFLRIPKDSLIYRQVITSIIFILTAGVHAVGLKTVGPTCDTMPTIRWHLSMGLAIVVEDFVKSMFWSIGPRRENLDRKSSRGWRVFGYVWVWTYLGWSLPKIRFPAVDCEFEYGVK